MTSCELELDGLNLYGAYFDVNGVDATGLEVTKASTLVYSDLISKLEKWEKKVFPNGGTLNEKILAFRNEIKVKRRVLHWKYFYTKDQGWIDLGHFSEASYMRLNFSEDTVKFGGESIEYIQFFKAHIGFLSDALQDDATSAFTREDLRSNRLGAEFTTFIKQHGKNSDSYAELFKRFLSKFQPIENPRKAPDWDELPATQRKLESRGYWETLGYGYENFWKNMLQKGIPHVGKRTGQW